MNESRNVVLCKWQPELLTALLDLGADVHLVLDRWDRAYENLRPDLLGRCRSINYLGSFDSLEELSAVAVAIAMRLDGPAIDRVVSHNELSQFGAAYLEFLLCAASDPRDPLMHVSHRDKRLMKRRVRDAGVATARFVSVPDQHDPAAATAVLEAFPAPLIIKPAAGYGATSTRKVSRSEDVAEAIATFAFEPFLRSRQLIVEEFVENDMELAVDAMWSKGEAVALVVHRYHENRMTIDQNSLDGSRVLREEDFPEIYGRIRAIHRRVNPALGIRDCATHMEVFVQPSGKIVFSEIATRVGGAWIPNLLTAYHGRSIWELMAQVALCGTCPEPNPVYPYVAGVSVRPRRRGIITAMPAEDALRAFPGIVDWRFLRRVGERARLSHPSDYYLHIILGAHSTEELYERCRRAVGTFVIETAESTFFSNIEVGAPQSPVLASH